MWDILVSIVWAHPNVLAAHKTTKQANGTPTRRHVMCDELMMKYATSRAAAPGPHHSQSMTTGRTDEEDHRRFASLKSPWSSVCRCSLRVQFRDTLLTSVLPRFVPQHHTHAYAHASCSALLHQQDYEQTLASNGMLRRHTQASTSNEHMHAQGTGTSTDADSHTPGHNQQVQVRRGSH